MIHYGDIGDIDGSSVEPVDVVVGGSPCQDLSVIGSRAGMVKRCVCGYETAALSTEETCPICGSALTKTRSALFAEQIRIIKEMDSAKGKYPRYMLWENVSGALTSNKGEDFRAVLARTAQVVDPDADIPRPPAGKWPHAGLIMGDGWSIAWRLVDAQYWGVTIADGNTGDVLRMGTPQRRRRLSLVADFQGDTAGQLLFSAPGEAEVARRVGTGSGSEIHAVSKCVSGDSEACGSQGKEAAADTGTCIGKAVCYGIASNESNAIKSSNPYSGIYEADIAKTLDTNGGSPACNQGGIAVCQNIVLNDQGGDVMHVSEEVCGTLRAQEHGHQPIVLQGNMIGRKEKNGPQGSGINEGVSFMLNATDVHAVLVAGFCSECGAKTRTIGYENEKSPTLRAEAISAAVISVENHQTDGRVKIVEVGKDGPKGVHSQMLNNPEENFVVSASKTTRCTHWFSDGQAGSLVATDYKEPPIVCHATYQQVYDEYIARRLTPLECERLQGYPIVRRVKTTIMTKDEYIAYALASGHIIADTETGKVYATRGGRGKRLDTPKELTGTMANGYRVITIRQDKCKMQCRIHRIIWIAAHGIIPDGYVVDHINSDKTDNRLANLQLLTAADNSTKARKDGRYKTRQEAGRAKISDEVHDIIQYIYANSDTTMAQLSDAFGIAQSRVHQIIHDEPWTDIGQWLDSKGRVRQTTDTARYRALGNSICLPYWEFLARRIREQLGAFPTMASLFDGIAGFPLAFSEAGIKPVWSSEIDEFCNAVSKKRFPEEDET